MGQGVPALPAGESHPAHDPSYRRFCRPRQTLCPRAFGSGHAPTLERMSSSSHGSGQIHALAGRDPPHRHLRSIRGGRVCFRVDLKLWRPLDHHVRQGQPIYFRHLSTTDENLGDRSNYNCSLPSGGERDGGAVPQKIEGISHRPWRRRT